MMTNEVQMEQCITKEQIRTIFDSFIGKRASTPTMWEAFEAGFQQGFVRGVVAASPKEQKLEPAVISETNKKESALNVQVGGNHYKKFGDHQPWEVFGYWMSEEELLGFCKGTVIAYLARDKNGREDHAKALHTLQLYMEVSAKKQERERNETL